MKHRLTSSFALAAFLVTGAACLLAAAPAQQPATAERQLEAAIHREQVLGDVKGAIEQYKQLSQSTMRTVAAQALARLGQCYEKLGDAQLKEARATYERIVREFGDQAEPAKLAQARLAALGGGGAGNGQKGPVTRRILTDADDIDSQLAGFDGRHIRSLDSKTGDVIQVDGATGQKTRIPNKMPWGESDQSWYAVAFSRDGKQIAIAGWTKDETPVTRVRSLDGSAVRMLYAGKSVKDPDLVPVDWSPDGAWILGYRSGDGASALGLISSADGSFRVIRKTTVGLQGIPMFRFSPDGRYIAGAVVTPDVAPHTDVAIFPVDGTPHSIVAGHRAEDQPIGWTPDGKGLLFLSDRAGSWDIWRVPVSGGRQSGEPEALKKDFGYHFWDIVGVTPDGALLYLTGKSAGRLFFGAVDLETGKVTTAPALAQTRYTGLPSGPVYSPDGQSVLYISQRDVIGPGNNILTIRSTATGEERFLSPPMRFVNQMAWAPDGRSVVALGVHMGADAAIYRIDATTSAATKLRDLAFMPHLCPDGRTLVFMKAGPVITRRNLDTGEETEVVKSATLFYGVSPDCREIAYQDTGVIKIIPIGGGESRDVVSGLAPYYRLRWTDDGRSIIARAMGPSYVNGPSVIWRVPAAGGTPVKLDLAVPRMDSFSLHPDGRQFVMSVRDDGTSELWVLESFLTPPKSRK